MTYPRNEIVAPHYAETIEVLFCYNLKGNINIGGNHFALGGTQAFYVAPNMIHSMNYEKNDGEIYVIKIELEHLKKYIDISSIATDCGTDLAHLPRCINDVETIQSIVENLSAPDSSLSMKVSQILTLIDLLIAASDTDTQNPTTVNTKDLYQIINWTEENFKNRIVLEEVAVRFGYNKYYFCTKFKTETGTTYLSYINILRISHACKMLRNGFSVIEAAEQSGFDNVSYFIQLFKKMMGVTPKKYAQQV